RGKKRRSAGTHWLTRAGHDRPSASGANMTSYRTMQLGDSEIFYREAGDPGAATLLLLHGFPSSSAQYDQLMQRLSGRYHVIAPDYPGVGRSPALEGDTTFDRIADAVDAFIESKDLDHFSLYMFDFGAPVG